MENNRTTPEEPLGNVTDELYWLKDQGPTEQERAEEFMIRLFREAGSPWVTYAITGLCVLVFLVMLLISGGDSFLKPAGTLLLDFGANFFPKTCTGQWYRLITCAFVHIGIIHLAFNMFVFLQVGNLVERLFGHTLFLLIYLGAAITGSLLSVAIHPDVISAGASGAIFGVYGALIAYYVRFYRTIPRQIFDGLIKGAFFFVVVNLLLGLQPGIDNFAHLGGLFGGFIFGLAAALATEPDARKKSFPLKLILTAFLIVCVTGGAIYGLISYRSPQSTPSLQKFIQIYIDKEKMAVNKYNEAGVNLHANKITPDDYIKILRNKIIPVWQEVKKSSETVSVKGLNEQQKNIFEIFLNNTNGWLLICEKTCQGIETDQPDLIDEANSQLIKQNKLVEEFIQKSKAAAKKNH